MSTTTLTDTSVQKFLDLSTGHVSAVDAAKLDALKGNGDPDGRDTSLPRIIDAFYGWIIPLGYFGESDDDGEHLRRLEEELPTVAACVRYALAHDCVLLNFDRDAQHIDDLAAYEW